MKLPPNTRLAILAPGAPAAKSWRFTAVGQTASGQPWTVDRTFPTASLPIIGGQPLQLPGGELIALRLQPVNNVTQPGAAWIEVVLVGQGPGGDVELATIAQGYCDERGGLSLGPALQPLSSAALNQPALEVVTNPAAGVDWSFTPTYAAAVKPQLLKCTLVTSAAVANRRPVFQFQLLGLDVLRVSAPADQAASLTRHYYVCQRGLAATDTGNDVSVECPMPEWPDTATIRVTTTNLQAGDQWSAILLSLSYAGSRSD